MPQDDKWLSEYREVLADHRHYEVLRWTVVGLTYPTAFAAIAFAGRQWGFTSGRAFPLIILGSLWLIAGSLVFGQMHFYDQVRILRARELERHLGFENVSNKRFIPEPSFAEHQPWRTGGLAWWFNILIPCVVALAALLLGIAYLAECSLLQNQADRDSFGIVVGLLLLFATGFVYVCRVWIFRKKQKAAAKLLAEPADQHRRALR